jgi:hypothetical protein
MLESGNNAKEREREREMYCVIEHIKENISSHLGKRNLMNRNY